MVLVVLVLALAFAVGLEDHPRRVAVAGGGGGGGGQRRHCGWLHQREDRLFRSRRSQPSPLDSVRRPIHG
jgi:hypothetical protein